MILGILEPDGGSIEIIGKTMAEDVEAIRSSINFSAVYTHVPANLILIMSLIAGLGFGYDIFIIGLSLIPLMGVLFIFGMAMGIFISAAIFLLGPTAEWLGWPIPMILSLISGVYYPIDTLPRSTWPPNSFPPPISLKASAPSWSRPQPCRWP